MPSPPPPRSHSANPHAAGGGLLPHCALVLGALSTGCTRIHGLIETEDVLSTIATLNALGAPTRKVADLWEVLGRGVGGLIEPRATLRLGPSLAAAQLLMGAIAGQAIGVSFTGRSSPATDAVLAPLRQMGLQASSDGGPLTVHGSAALLPITHALAAPDDAITSAVLIAGLAAGGETTVVCAKPPVSVMRLLERFGALVRTEQSGDLVAAIVTGEIELASCDVLLDSDTL